MNEVRAELRVSMFQKNWPQIVVEGYPGLDPDGKAARRLVDLLVEYSLSEFENSVQARPPADE